MHIVYIQYVCVYYIYGYVYIFIFISLYMCIYEMDIVDSIEVLQCLHFAEYSTHAHITGRQKQTNREASWKHPLAFSSSFDTQMKA